MDKYKMSEILKLELRSFPLCKMTKYNYLMIKYNDIYNNILIVMNFCII